MKKETLESAINTSENINISGFDSGMNLKLERPTLLLHSCCGPCSTACIERLMDDYDITVFFYNPNITDEKEYLLRLDAQKTVIDNFNTKLRYMPGKISLIEGDYSPDMFYQAVAGFENELEGGGRCSLCFALRLTQTALMAKSKGFDLFATTLTVSPHKNYKTISELGKSIADELKIAYLDMDFKKKNGFARSIELSKEFGLYRQNYCGCEFSKWFEKD